MDILFICLFFLLSIAIAASIMLLLYPEECSLEYVKEKFVEKYVENDTVRERFNRFVCELRSKAPH